VRSPNPASGNTRIFTVSIRGYDQHINVADEIATGTGRAIFFALPLGEGDFTSYLNVQGHDGVWDFQAPRNDLMQHDNNLTIRIFVDNQPFTPSVDESVFMELTFSE
jgi:hypothetical protein